ncbi:MAG: type I-E CRISPR-associated protein Cas5/CasD [Desulfobacterales bacterium]|nr:type I-E CRISPR-associated protein Cas5/CasD [Desulfobacterales bacterium]
MSSEKSWLAIRFEGPLQSWGFDSQYNRRNTGLMPTKSATAGICCAALGYPRGGHQEREFLDRFKETRMTSIAMPKIKDKKELQPRRLIDYHTVQSTKTADGKTKDCHITHRQFLTDSAFGVVLEGESTLMSQIASALVDPKWGIWLGRKSCIPSSPVFIGLKNNRDEGFRLLIGDTPLEAFTRQEEVENFAEGRDSLPDAAASFATERRSFSPRRVRTYQATKTPDQ